MSNKDNGNWCSKLSLEKRQRKKTRFTYYSVFQQVVDTHSNLKLCPKLQFQKNLNVWEFLNARVALIIIWIFAPKIVILCKHRNNNNWKLLKLDNFWRQNSNSNRSQCIIITIIHQFLARKSKFWMTSLLTKLNFSDILWVSIALYPIQNSLGHPTYTKKPQKKIVER